MKNKKYWFLFIAIFLTVTAALMLIKYTDLKEFDVKLNNSNTGIKAEVIESKQKKYVAIDDLKDVLGIEFKCENNKFNIYMEDEFCIDSNIARKISDIAIAEDWGKEYVNTSDVETSIIQNGIFWIRRNALPVMPPKISYGGGYEIFISKDGRILCKNILD